MKPATLTVLSDDAIGQTADSIIAVQAGSGQIAWFPGGQTDPWDHVECAMALDTAGRHEAARAAYDWLRRTQNPDGSWFSAYRDDEVIDRTRESNFAAYLGVGLLHHTLSTGDREFVDLMWPTLQSALEFVLDLSAGDGTIRWARSPEGQPAGESLLTGCASMHHALRAAAMLARQLERPRPDWELAADQLGHAVAEHPERFSPRDRYSMDWYYPVLGGALRGESGRRRLLDGWDRFVEPELGVRCVADRPWVTGAETCELVLALCSLGELDRATAVFASMQHLRHDDGSYWTGYVFADQARWPEERTTWTGAAVLLASAFLAGELPTTTVFGTLAPRPTYAATDGCDCALNARNDPSTISSTKDPLWSAA